MKSIGLVLLVAMTACAESPTVLIHTDSSPIASFASYRTFRFGLAGAPLVPLQESARSLAVERHMRSLVVAELVRKGYAEQPGPANPDFVVTFASGYAEETPSVEAQPFEKAPAIGVIVIDAFDASSAAHVWHGTGETEVSPARVNEQLLQASVNRVLASFPVRGAEGRLGVTSRQAP